MKKLPANLFIAFSVFTFTLLLQGCGGEVITSNPTAPPIPAAIAIPNEAESADATIRALEARVKMDNEDFIAYNKLAGYYLQKVRETGNLNFLQLASQAAKASLNILPAEQNAGGLAAIAQVEFTSHEFVAARKHAEQLIQLDAKKSSPHLLLGDTLIELGEYEKAKAVFHQLDKRTDGASIESRLAKLAWLAGNTEAAKIHFTNAIIFAQNQPSPSREAIAWNRWQLGEVYFSTGDYDAAEQQFRESLITFPNYFRALAALGRALAAKGDFASAILNLEQATRILPDPGFVATLGDLYKLAGRDKEATAQYALVEQINKLNQAQGTLYNRQIALFYADHDLHVEAAYQQAKLEYETRRDIYGADALAWTALKAGKIAEAQSAIQAALNLGTRDARLFYHAGMIAKAAGDLAAARDFLNRALILNPEFDALQALQAKRALAEIR
ncbi:MAG: tetratricopeptide repeat protein [Acidobacteriota bacterium]